MSQYLSAEDRLRCANPTCEGQLSAFEYRCPRCHEAQQYCRACGATGRALARFCRCCAGVLRSDWALEHAGFRYRPSRQIDISPTSTFQLSWQLTIESEMVAAPLAARGLIIITIVSGHIVILDEIDGEVRAELKAPAPLNFTPVIVDNLLIVSTGEGIIAYDLIAALYGNIAKGNVKVWHHQFSDDEQVTRPLLATVQTVLVTVRHKQGARLIALDKKSGYRTAEVDIPTRTGKTSTPFIKEKHLFIATKDGSLMAIDWSRMEVIANAKAPKEIDINVAICGRGSHIYYVLSNGQLWNASLNNDNASLILQPFGDTGGLIINAISATEKYLAIAHGSGLTLYDRFGSMLWETTLDANSIITLPLLEGEAAWVIDDTGMMFYFDLSVSVPKLRQRLFEMDVALPPIMTYDHIIFTNRVGVLKVFKWKRR